MAFNISHLLGKRFGKSRNKDIAEMDKTTGERVEEQLLHLAKVTKLYLCFNTQSLAR